IRARLFTGLRGHRVKGQGLPVPLWPIPPLGQVQKSGGAGRHTRSRRGLGQRTMAMSQTRTHFTFRIDTWTPDGESVVEHVVDVEDLQLAKATYLAACQRWPGTPITLRQGTRAQVGIFSRLSSSW